ILQSTESLLRIPHSINSEFVCGQFGSRLQKKLANLSRTLVIAAIADPHYIVCAAVAGYRVKDRRVGSFVQRPSACDVEMPAVNIAQSFAEREYAVKAIDAKEANLFRRRRGAMMRIVKEQAKSELIAEVKKKMRQLRRIPFVQNYDLIFAKSLAPIAPRL